MKFINIVLVHPLKKESYIRSKKGHIDPFRKAIFYSKLRRIVRYLMFLFRDIMTCKSGGKHLHYIYIFLITDSPCFMPRCGPPISSICACPERNESGGVAGGAELASEHWISVLTKYHASISLYSEEKIKMHIFKC